MKEYWTSLDGLRALAVGIVMLAHAGFPYPRSGGVGVDIFFVLSGFLITGILSKEYQLRGSVSRKNFYIRRFLRLSPCLFACLMLFVLLFYISFGTVKFDTVGIVLTYTGNYARALYSYDLQSMKHCWSLAIEEQYYILWPLVIVFLERKAKSNKSKFLILFSLSLLLGIYRASMVGVFSPARIYFALDTHMDGLVMGSSLAYLVPLLSSHRRQAQVVFYKLLSRFVMPSVVVGVMILMYLVTWGDDWMGMYGFTLVALASCVIILELVLSPFSFLRPLLEKPFLVYCGKISYGLYLYHYPIYYFVISELGDMNRIYRGMLMVSLSFLAASLSYHFIEMRFLVLKHRFTNSYQKTPKAQ